MIESLLAVSLLVSQTPTVFVPVASMPPALDGIIGPVEWAEATVTDISDTLGADGTVNDTGSCLLYAMHNGASLFLAVDCPGDTTLADYSQFSFYVDDDNSGTWPDSANSEGVNAISEQDGWMCAWFHADYSWSGWYPSGLVSFSFYTGTGHISCEWSIPLVRHQYDTMPQYIGAFTVETFDTVGTFVFYYDDAAPGYIGYWPQDFPGPFYEPSGYGEFVLLPTAGVGEGLPPEPGQGLTLTMAPEGFLISGYSGPVQVYDATGRLILSREIKGKTLIGPLKPGVYFVRAGKLRERVPVIR